MALTCYANLQGSNLGSFGPPAKFGIFASYCIIDTTTNTAKVTASGEPTNTIELLINAPITKQADLLPIIQSAIQAQEPGSPSLSFIWIGL